MTNPIAQDLATLRLCFGTMVAPLADQLLRPAREMALFQREADAITLLSIHSILSEAETHRARHRLMKAIQRKLR